MKKITKLLYMLFAHPFLFFRYSIKKESRFFLLNGKHQNIKIKRFSPGKNVRIGNYTRISCFENGNFKIGDNTYICENNTFLVGADLSIGENVLMASGILVTTENHSIDPLDDRNYGMQPLKCAPVNIGNGSWIGEKVIILPGVNIGVKCVIGAGSVVTTSVPDYCIAVGNPAKVIKQFNFENSAWEAL